MACVAVQYDGVIDDDFALCQRATITLHRKSAILNFPEFKDLLPRPVSLSPRDVQEAAAKAATMSNIVPTPPSQPLLADSNVAEELGEIIELPSLEGCLNLPDPSTEFLVDSFDRWVYPSWPVEDIGGFWDYISDHVAENDHAGMLIWDC
ncbi:hypothetical protein Tco_1155674 [Tanacetum coccineum]